MSYSPFGQYGQPQPHTFADQRIAALEAEVIALRKKTRSMNASLWVIGVIVLLAIVLPVAYAFTAGFLSAL